MRTLKTLKIVAAIALTLGLATAQGVTLIYGNAGGGSTNPANAAQLMTSNSAVVASAVVTATCTTFTTSGAFAFGTYTSGQQANVDTSMQVAANCTAGSPYTMYISAGSNYNMSGFTGWRALSNGGTGYLAYAVYVNNPGNALWGDYAGSAGLGSGLSAVGTGSSQSYTVAARIPGGQAVPTGNYTDNVVATLAY
jgi:spore coat protein U-like protein